MNWRTKLMHPGRTAPDGFESLAVPTYRGSTVVFPSQEGVRDGWQVHETSYSYGSYGTPTTAELSVRLAELEGAQHTFLTPNGQSAIALIHLAFASAGDHVLLPRNAYGTNQDIASGMLARFGIEVEPYDPLIGAGIAGLIRPTTVLIWCESPGSITMEIQDVPGIVAAAHERGVLVALDNTYSAGVLFDAFAHGVDVSMQALTKYVGGHSDLLLGSVSVNSEIAYAKVGEAHRLLGMAVSPDECALALRGLQTLGVRLEKMEASALRLALWLAEQPMVERVLHPALPSCGGHEFWTRDFHGSASLFSIVFQEGTTQEQANAFVDALRLFKIGWSWGGTTSMVMAYPRLKRANGKLVRLHIGLEDAGDLLADIKGALQLTFSTDVIRA
ncbi:MAG: cystathionine beta-lyase [Acidobacteriaceae bacterium]|nr:cystathionine beta-lyase [Acidobacteriaceae bacterium]